jgi:DNA-binding protein HU-beta
MIQEKGDYMNKAELVEAIAKKTGGTKAGTEAALDAFIDAVTASLTKGDSVALIGFGTFTVSKRAARKGRNPATGAEIKIPASKVAKFSAGAKLKKAVNKK